MHPIGRAATKTICMWSIWFAVAGLAVGVALFGRPSALPSAPLARTERIRIVIPARNESASLGNLLGDIAGSVDACCDVVVVDDGSTDSTAEIARSFPFVQLVCAPEPPAGWRGKPWACMVGARGEISSPDAEELIFLDADVRLEPGAIESLVASRRAHGGVLSVQPFHTAPTMVEELSAVFNLVSMMGAGVGSPRPHGMFGPVVCCRADDYFAVGGHGSVRGAVAEDVELAGVFKRAGIAVRIMTGGRLVSFRMYPKGLGALIEGWSKNMATGATSVPIWRALGVAWWIAGLVSASSIALDWSEYGWGSVVVSVVTVLSLRRLLRRVGTFRWWVAVAFPIVTAFFVAVFLRSIWLTHIRRAVTWSGRVIDLRPSATPVVADSLNEVA